MKKIAVFTTMFLLLSIFAFSQSKFEVEKYDPNAIVLKFKEMKPDTFNATLLYDGKVVEGKLVRKRYRCTFDANDEKTGKTFYTFPVAFLDAEGKTLDAGKVIAWQCRDCYESLSLSPYTFTNGGSLHTNAYIGANATFLVNDGMHPASTPDSTSELTFTKEK